MTGFEGGGLPDGAPQAAPGGIASGQAATSGPNQLSVSAAPNQLSTAGAVPAEAAPPAPEPAARRGFAWRGLALRIGIIVAIGAGAFILRDRLSGAASDLRVGDCFDEPSAEVTEVLDVQHQPCGEAHDAEVFHVVDYTGDSYPVVGDFDDYVIDTCIPAFESYVGRSFEAAVELDMSYFSPTLSGWGQGDREITCYLVNVDQSKLTMSMKAGGG